ncbi:MAG: crossover junction endodeoxyribonuclease RuvC [Candidatus Altimarinota bacterium]
MNEKIVLGIDPGLATIGYGFMKFRGDDAHILDFGVIETPAGLELPERLLMIQQDLTVLLEKYRPDEAYVEEVFFSTNTKTAISVAHARGVIMSSLASHGLRPRSLTPNQVKLGMTGDGSADKRQVQHMLKMQFSLSQLPEPDDAADALAIAYCGGLAFWEAIP